jgi:signal transduction histidine kinase
MDVKEIGRALRLLFDNALSCGAPSPVIQVSYCENRLHRSPAVTVIVSDNGPGVPRQHRERVFEPFFTTKMSGTGLGLAVCKRIVSAHGGDIYVGVPLLQGASVYITLPQHAKLPDAPR